VNVFDPAVITIGTIEAGTTRNVIPETAHLLGTVRTVSEETRVPGAMANLGTRPDGGPVFPNHSNRMLLNEAALATGVAMHVAVALRFFERGGKIAG
jgi:metal-dependent amidase/aminoacylase/carboxypeptidase family protein